MKNWKDIKKDIYAESEPLSEDSWKEMSGMLEQSGSSRKRWWLLLVAAVFLFGLFWVLKPEREGNQPKAKPSEIVKDNQSDAVNHQPETLPTYNETTEEAESAALMATQPKGVEKASGKEIQKSIAGEKETASADKKELLKPVQDLPVKGLNKPSFTSSQPALRITKDLSRDTNTPQIHQKTLENGRLQLRVFAGTEFSLNAEQYNSQGEQTHKNFEEATNNAVKPGLGWDAGLEVRYRVWKGIRISSGFGFRQMVTRNQYEYTVNEVPVIDSASGNILAYLPSNQPEQKSEHGSNTFTYLSIPISLTYEYPVSRKWALTGEAVYQHSFLLSHSGKEVDPTTLELQDSKNEDLASDMGAYQLRIGLRYQLQDNIFIALEPAYRSTLKDIYQSGDASWKPRDIALNMIMIYQFK